MENLALKIFNVKNYGLANKDFIKNNELKFNNIKNICEELEKK